MKASSAGALESDWCTQSVGGCCAFLVVHILQPLLPPGIRIYKQNQVNTRTCMFIYICVYVYTHVRYNIVRLNMHIKTHSFISIYLDSDLIHWLPGFLGKICQ